MYRGWNDQPGKLAAASGYPPAQLFHRLADSASDILFRLRLHPSLRLEYVNRAFIRIIGYSANEANTLLLHSQSGLIDTVEREYVVRLYESGELEGHPHMLRARAKDGQSLWLETAVSLVRSEGTEVTAVEGIARNVTRQWLAEQALRSSEERLRRITNHMTDLITQVDASGRYEYVSPSFTRLMGYAPEDVLGKSLFDFIDPADTEAAMKAMAELDAGQNPIRVELRYKHARGDSIWLECEARSIHNEKGQVTGWIISSQDIGKRRKAQDDLQFEKFFLENVFQSVQDGICVIGRDQIIQRANPTLTRWYAHAAPLEGKKCYQVYYQRQEPCETCRCHEALRTSQPSSSVMPYLGSQGDLQGWIELFSFPMIDPERKEVLGVIQYARNITGQKQRERDLEAIASIASALRSAVTREEMYPILLEQAETLLNANACALVVDQHQFDFNSTVSIEAASGLWSHLGGARFSTENARRALLLVDNQPYCENNPSALSLLAPHIPVDDLDALAGVPLGTGTPESVFGTLWIGRKTPMSGIEMRTLVAIGNIVANAIQRAGLYEQTRRYADAMAAVSHVIHKLVTVTTQEEVYARLAEAVDALLQDVSAVIVGLYGQDQRPVCWVYALKDGKPASIEEVPGMLHALAGKGAWPLLIEPSQTFSGGVPIPQMAVYIPLSTKKEVLGELQVYRKGARPFSVTDQEVLTILTNTAAISIQNTRLYENLQDSHRDLVHAYDATLESLARALELRDRETEGHTRRVADMSAKLAARVGLEGEALSDLRRGAQLHDIGKMGVPDGILLKPHPLTKEEWVIMRKHTEYAMEVLAPIDYLKGALDVPHYHHEKWDGSGYPHGLKGENIPLSARIFSIVDVWDALTSDRPYRLAWGKRRVIEHMRQQSGKHFDPRLLDAFLEMIQEEPIGDDEEDLFDLISA